MEEMTKIDTLKNKPHVRHLATTDARGWAHTKCGRRVIMYWNHVEQDSYFFTDGTRYAKPCKICLPVEYAEYIATTPGAALGSINSEKKIKTARKNGKRGGRPRMSAVHPVDGCDCLNCNTARDLA